MGRIFLLRMRIIFYMVGAISSSEFWESRAMPLRTFLRRLHLFLACTVGLIFVFSGVTGSIIVFDHAIDEMLNPHLLLVEKPAPDAERLSYQALLEQAEAHYAGTEFYVSGLQAPRVADSSQMFWIKSPRMHAKAYSELYLDPYTGAVLGARRGGSYFTSFVYMLHHTLLMGQNGKLLIGYSGIAILLMLGIGVYLAWPQPGQWRKSLTLKRGARRTRRLLDLHRVGGLYGLVVMMVTVFSGISIIFPDAYRATTELASATAPAPVSQAVEAPPATAPVALDSAIAHATAVLEGSRFSRAYFPPERGSKTWLMTFAHPDDPKKSHGYERLTVHPYTGEVVQHRRWPLASGGDRFLAWLFPLHSGEALGMAGRVLVWLGGLLPALLLVTGIWRWRRKAINRAQLAQSALAPARG